MTVPTNPEFESNVVRDSGGKFSEKNASEQPGGTDALPAPFGERHVSRAHGKLVPGEFVTGTATGFSATGREMYRSTWSGIYVGIQEPDPDDPFVDEYGNEDPGETIHLFRDGEVNGIKQQYFGFPVDQFEAGDKQRAAEELAEYMNDWYGCASQAAVFYAEEVVNHPDDPEAALSAARARYDADPARKDGTWHDALSPDEAMQGAQTAITALVEADADNGVFPDGFEDMPHLWGLVPTNDRVAAARLIIAASKPESRTW